jgi:NAD(P)-dependent dehydrogenase (short-subunit alcohol dehydrogenase family)
MIELPTPSGGDPLQPGNPYHHRPTAVRVVRDADLRGRQCVVTGASSGIGLEAARALAIGGAQVVLGVRDVRRGEEAAASIRGDSSGNAQVVHLDLRDLRSVREFAAQVTGPVDIFMANAGVSKTPDTHLPNGLDVRFATNHLGHFALAHMLHDRLSVRGARIVVVSSAAHHGAPVRLDDLQWHAREHVDLLAYAESKTANILFAQEATRRWSVDGIFANAVLPGSSLTGLQRFHSEDLKRQIGFVTDDGTRNPILKTAAEAAATCVWAAIAPELEGRGGLVLEDCCEAVPVGPNVHPWTGVDPGVLDPEVAADLWRVSLTLAGMTGIHL